MSSETRPIKLDPALTDRLRADREHFHTWPELSGSEVRTSEYIEQRLRRLGAGIKRFGTTGLVGVLENGNGPVVAYRADMDGLPVEERTGLPFSSKATGHLAGNDVPVMHACGHDVHMAVGLAAAAYLSENRDDWWGTALFVFQQAEETAAGALEMIENGLWDRLPHPSVVLGMHVMPYAAGTVHIPIGTAMSMGDSWRVTIHGRGAHGSQPEKAIDPVVIGAAMVMRLQTVVSREVGPRETAVVTVGTFHAGLKENVIPDYAELTVNMRTFDSDVRSRVLSAVRRIIAAEADAAGAVPPTIEIVSEFPKCFNDPHESMRTIEHIRSAIGEGIVNSCDPHMASEDFGRLGEAADAPSVFWFLGGTPLEDLEGDAPVPVNHSPFFAPVSEPTLTNGTMAAVAALLHRLRAAP